MSAHVAIVTGAGGALGHATAVTLAASGLTVVAVDRNEHALRKLHDGVRPELADTTDPAAAKSVIDRIAGEVGPPDVLVNTIGTFRPGDALTTTPDTLRLMIDVNLGPALWLSQAVAPHMQQQGSGAIVHVAARPGIEPSGGLAAYSASKAALVHLTPHPRRGASPARDPGERGRAPTARHPHQPGHISGRSDDARGRARGDRRRNRIPGQRRRSASQRSDTAGIRRIESRAVLGGGRNHGRTSQVVARHSAPALAADMADHRVARARPGHG